MNTKNFFVGLVTIILFIPLFSIILPAKVALASGCPGDMDYSGWTDSQKLTVFSTLPLSHGINLKSWTNPSGTALDLGAIDWGADMYCNPYPGPSSATSTITILPTNYSFTINTLQRQSASGYGSYAWSYTNPNDVTDNPLPSFNWPNFSASCGGWQCNITGYGDFINYARVGAQGNYDYNDMNGFPPFVENNLGYSVTGTLPSISSITFSASTTQQIAAEDSIINDIQSTGHIHVKIDTPSIGNSYTAAIPATNCVALSPAWTGSGPDTRKKIVFMRGAYYLGKMSIYQYIIYVNDIIGDGFRSIEPFKSHINQLSFYVDLDDIDERTLDFSNGGYPIQADQTLKSLSACGSNSIEYIFLSENPNLPLGYTHDHNGVPANVVYMGISNIEYETAHGYVPMPIIAMHESGHAIGLLLDEYPNQSDIPFESDRTNGENCSVTPFLDFRSSIDNRMYGSDVSISTEGCFESENYEGSPYYRPSPDSIMNNDETDKDALTKFNVISCGYVISVLNGEPIDKDHAQTHWPECLQLAQKGFVIDKGIPPIRTTPTIAKISATTMTPRGNLSISGSNFTVTDNAVELINTATNQTYDIPGLTSTGKALQFSIPASVPAGTYTLKVGAFNSDWSNSIPITITAGPTPSPTPSPSPSPTANPKIPPTLLSLAPGSTGVNVVALQNYLIQYGYLSSNNNTGYYGPLTAAAGARYESTMNTQSVSTPLPTPSPTATPYPTYSPSPTIYPTPTPTQTPISSPIPTATPSPLPSPTPTYSPLPTPSPTLTPSPIPSPSPTSIPKQTPSPTSTPSPTPTVKSSPTPSPTPTPSPSSSPQAVSSSGGITSMSAAIWNAIQQYFDSWTKMWR